LGRSIFSKVSNNKNIKNEDNPINKYNYNQANEKTNLQECTMNLNFDQSEIIADNKIKYAEINLDLEVDLQENEDGINNPDNNNFGSNFNDINICKNLTDKEFRQSDLNLNNLNNIYVMKEIKTIDKNNKKLNKFINVNK